LISYEKKNPTITFIQLLRKKNLKIKQKNKYSDKKKKKEKSYLNVVASEAEKKKNKFINYIN
jgi:hypothetical protein